MQRLIVISLAIFLTGCGTYQPLDNSFQLSPGMSKQEVVSVMGNIPVKTEFSANVEEWHYCKPGQYVAVYFVDSKVYAMKPYSVTGRRGDCSFYVKMGNYREPDSVREYRIQFR
jgi:outer membrane protein assembly factor BamE (lipoprotein component of BamABCDE complex)